MSEHTRENMVAIHQGDISKLTDMWLRETNTINSRIDEAMKTAQDGAYAVGYRRGCESIAAVRQQRDELLVAAKTYTERYLQDERDEPDLCHDMQHHEDVVSLFAAIAKAEQL